ncbi:PAS domain S-box-containing protein/diguanylate cyclase (GGDEF) domain-containing protein [Rhizobiales bacterium GAS113]|nr:PAS domain S-box-containing protein/diguanylate cyclase (GGDEF) domain-containing protein [Rhizobiales bacterium GAS113]
MSDVYAKLGVLETAIEHLHQGFCVFDRELRLVQCNSRYAQMHGLPPELTRPGTPLRLVLERRFEAGHNPSQDREECIRLWMEGAGSSKPSKTMIHFNDGSIVCRDHQPLSDGGFVSIFEDVTEGLQTANELDRTKNFLDTVVDNIPAVVMVKDARDLRYVFANRSAERYLGRSRAAMIGRTAAELFGKEDADKVAARDEAVLRSEKGRTFQEYTVEGQNGETRSCTSRRVLMNDRDGRPRYILLVVEDVTEQLKTEKELDRTQSFLDKMIDNIPAIVLVKDVRERRYSLINRAAESFFGVPRAEMMGKNCHEVFSQEEAVAIMVRDDVALLSGDEVTVSQNSLDTPGNGVRQVTAKRLVLRDETGKPQSLVQVLEDHTERLATQAELDRARNFLDVVIENIPTAILVKDVRNGCHIVINRAAETFFGVPRETMLNKACHDVFRKEEADAIQARDREVLESGKELAIHEHSMVTPAGETRWVIAKRLRLNDAEGKAQFFVIAIDDVTEQKRSAERIAFMAHHDTLTGLPNRAAFSERLTLAFDEVSKSAESFSGESFSAESFAVLCIDVDRFKEINDVFGHAAGDEFLRTVSRRISEAADGSFLARLGGDEFTMITPAGPQPATAEALVRRLFDSVVGDVEIGGHQMRVSLSVGISVFPADGADASTLLSNADAALYRAKKEGRDTFRFFDAEMDRRTRERHALQHDLRAGINRDELVLHYQPQARMKGEIIGFEALIRWMHPKRGLIAPGNFIPAAEENGLIVAIGEWTLREACREAASWEVPLQIALNLSPVQFRYGDLPSLVHRVLLETGLVPSRLELEITESALIGDFARAVSILRRLKALGVKIAMDDFGTGYSSLSYLQSFPFDKIKIDRSFIMNLGDNPQSATIVRAVIGLARGLDLPVIAEGVETQDQLAFLTNESCDEVQGYLIGRPRPINDYARLTGATTAVTHRALLVG